MLGEVRSGWLDCCFLITWPKRRVGKTEWARTSRVDTYQGRGEAAISGERGRAAPLARAPSGLERAG
jgi:hypothetical protein